MIIYLYVILCTSFYIHLILRIKSIKMIPKLNRRLIQMNPQLRLRHYLRCSDEEANELIQKCPELADLKEKNLEESIMSLLRNDITHQSIMNNPYLLTMTGGRLKI
jgi:hypothetical protein